MVRNVKNPILLARIIMNKTKHVFLSGYGALELAKNEGLYMEKEGYFITEHQLQEFKKFNKKSLNFFFFASNKLKFLMILQSEWPWAAMGPCVGYGVPWGCTKFAGPMGACSRPTAKV